MPPRHKARTLCWQAIVASTLGILQEGMGSRICVRMPPFHCPLSVPLPTIKSETWLVHAKVREPHPNPRFVWTFPASPFKTRARGRKFIQTGGFRCGSRTFARTSQVSDWIVGRGTDPFLNLSEISYGIEFPKNTSWNAHHRSGKSVKRAQKGFEHTSFVCRPLTQCLGCTPRGSCDNTLLRRVLRRFSRPLSRRF